jgi:SAM-dependent methyltransferase
VATAEALPVASAAVDAVTVAQAWHWFDHRLAAAECARVLRPAGVLSVAWHVRAGPVRRRAGRRRPTPARLGAPRGDDVVLATPFGPIQPRLFRFDPILDPPGLRRLAASWSYVAVRPDAEAVLDAVLALGRKVAGPDGLLVVPHVTRCFRAVRG